VADVSVAGCAASSPGSRRFMAGFRLEQVQRLVPRSVPLSHRDRFRGPFLVSFPGAPGRMGSPARRRSGICRGWGAYLILNASSKGRTRPALLSRKACRDLRKVIRPGRFGVSLGVAERTEFTPLSLQMSRGPTRGQNRSGQGRPDELDTEAQAGQSEGLRLVGGRRAGGNRHAFVFGRTPEGTDELLESPMRDREHPRAVP